MWLLTLSAFAQAALATSAASWDRKLEFKGFSESAFQMSILPLPNLPLMALRCICHENDVFGYECNA